MISDQLLYLFYYYARRKSQQDQRWQEESEDEQLERQTGFVACVGQEGPAQHVPAVTTETVEWCAPAVLRLA